MSPGSTWGYTEVAGVEQPEIKVTSSISTGSPKLSYRWRHWAQSLQRGRCKSQGKGFGPSRSEGVLGFRTGGEAKCRDLCWPGLKA